jgi:hypothetical protein
VEARTRDPWGQYLGEETPGEDRPAEPRLTPAAVNGSTGCSSTLGAGRGSRAVSLRRRQERLWERHGGQASS